MNSLIRGSPFNGIIVWSCLLAPTLIGQQQDPFADIARASLPASCNPNTNFSQLQAAQDRLSRLQAAKSSAQSALSDTSALTDSGDSLSYWSKALGTAQVLQGLSDGFMSVTSFWTGSNGNNLYKVAKSAGTCANGAVTDTVSPAECLNSVAEATADLKGVAGSVISATAAGAATGANLAEKKYVEGAASASAGVAGNLINSGVAEPLANPVDGFGKGVVALDAALSGDIPKALVNGAQAAGKFVADETLSKAFDTVGDVVKAGFTVADGVGNLSNAQASGDNLNQVTSSAYNSIADNVMKLSAKINDTQTEVDRLMQCQQQLAAPAADVLDTLGPLLADPSGTGASGGNSAMLKKLADSMAETSSSSAGANVQLPQIDPASVPSQGQSGQSFGNSLLNALSSQLPSSVIPNSKTGNAGVQGPSNGATTWTSCDTVTCTMYQGSLPIKRWSIAAPVTQKPCPQTGNGAACGVQ